MTDFSTPQPPTSKLRTMDHNARIEAAITDLESQDHRNITATAKKWGVARETLSKRFRGETGTKQDATSYTHRQLTDIQEKTLIRYINKLSDRGLPPTPQIVKNLAEEIAGVTLGKNWVSRFCSRYRNQLTSVYLRTIDHKRKLADNSSHFEHFYKHLREKIEKYNISASNIYNFDEKGFLIGLSRSTKRVISIEALKSKRTARASQDGSREFITLIASICADGSHLAPALIYQGASHDLQDTWLDDFDTVRDQAFFASSENGWSCDILGQNWLESVFDRSTKEKAKRERRLLLVDGHSSHVNMRFINYADANRILLAVLPPHSTHRLQPLDVGLFSPLATYYSQQIDKLLAESQGLVRLTKRDFWPLFREAWNQAFTEKNVRNAWQATGIYPFNASKVLSTFVQAEVTLQTSPKQIKTPVSTRAIRRTFKQLQKEGHVNERAKVLLHAGEKLATELEIVQYENRGLRKAIFHEKKKRKRGKAMNLYDPMENEGQALFFSPAKVARVRQRIADEEQAKHQRKQTASDKKLQAAIIRDEKAREAEERKITRNLARQAARELLVQEKAERQAVRQAQRAQKAAETTKRKQDAGKAQAQRIRVKEAAQKAAKSKKRPLDVDESKRPKKRTCTHASRSRFAADSNDSTSLPDTIEVRPSANIIAMINSAQPSNRMRNAGERRISLPLRSRRNTRLPARFL